MTAAASPISCIVAESSSVTADKSAALSFDVWIFFCTSLTTSSSFCALEMISFIMRWSFSMKVLIPLPKSATSSFERIVILLVKSPCLLSMPFIIPFISLFATLSLRITNINTPYNVSKSKITLSAIINVLRTLAVLYFEASSSPATPDWFLALLIIASTCITMSLL